MAKKKEFESTVSVSELSKYTKENMPAPAEIIVGEMKVLVKPYIGAADFAEVVDNVVDGSFDWNEESGELEYYPYFTNFLRDMQIIEKFTNIRLPQNYTERYEAIRVLDHNGVIDMILAAIDPAVVGQLDVDIGKAIEFEKCKTARVAHQSIVYMGRRMRALGLSARNMINKLDSLADAISDDAAVGEFIKSVREAVAADESSVDVPEESHEAPEYIDGERIVPIRGRE